MMCDVIVFVIDSTYSNETQLIRVLSTVLGEETFDVPVDERAHETWLQFMSGKS